MNNYKANWAATIVAFLLALVGVAISVSQTDEPTPSGGHKKTITFRVDKSGLQGVQTGTVTVPQAVVNSVEPNLEQGLRPEVAPGMTQEQITATKNYQEVIKQTLPPIPTEGATAGVSGCRTQFVQNQSSRHGVRPVEFTLHLTVSPNVPGWADVNAIVNLFNHVSSQASSNFVLDGEGHCAYIVPIEAKAWTQAAGNPYSVSVEVIDTGRESIYLAPAGMKQLKVIAKTVSQRTGIPLRQGKVSGNCLPVLSGIIQHKDWSICGGGHVDITPYSVPAIVKYIAAGSSPSKKVVWIQHRKAVHLQYVAKCRTTTQRKSPECAALRSKARVLDKLIARK